MKNYEGIFILNSKLKESQIDKIIHQLTQKVESVKNIDKVGIKQLAYSVKKHTIGYFIIIYFRATDEQRAKIELTAKEIENILKFIIIVDT